MRRSRLHDEDNVFGGWPALRHLPSAIGSTAARKCLGVRPKKPWWPYAATGHLEPLLTRESRAIEFGSGNSTLWLARRVQHLVSIEHDPRWHRYVRGQLTSEGLSNVTLLLKSEHEIFDLADLPQSQFDFAFVDGPFRWKCIQSILPRMRGGSFIYLDNSDGDEDMGYYADCGERKLANRVMAELASHPKAQHWVFRDFAPGEMFVHAGMLVRLPHSHAQREP